MDRKPKHTVFASVFSQRSAKLDQTSKAFGVGEAIGVCYTDVIRGLRGDKLRSRCLHESIVWQLQPWIHPHGDVAVVTCTYVYLNRTENVVSLYNRRGELIATCRTINVVTAWGTFDPDWVQSGSNISRLAPQWNLWIGVNHDPEIWFTFDLNLIHNAVATNLTQHL